jgi:outer membrane protein
MKRVFILIAIIGFAASCETPQTAETPKEKAVADSDTIQKNESVGLRVAFIYGDTINENYHFLQDAQEELDKEQKVIEQRINRKLQKAEQRAMELQKQAATMTQMQVQEAQLELQNLDIEIQQFQEKLATEFREREIELQEEYTERVNKMLDEYNADGTYDMILNFQPGGNLLWIDDAFDITDEVLEKLNRQYDEDLQAKAQEEKTQ